MKNFIVSIIIIAILNWQNVILAGTDESTRVTDKSKDIAGPNTAGLPLKKQIIFDARYILGSPERMKSRGYLTWGTLLVTAALMYSEKKNIREWIQDNTTSSTDDISRMAKPLGDRGVVPAIAATFYLSGLLSDNQKSKETGTMIIESFFYTGVLTLIGQYIFAEERPDKGGKMHFFRRGGHGISGHAAIASCIAGPLNRQYLQIKDGDSNPTKIMKYTGKVIVYGYPFLTGLSRLHDDEHYGWDVLSGFAIGYTIGELIADAHTKSKKKTITVIPFIYDKEKGIIASIKF